MYYCLKEDYLLRGWEKLPTGIVRRKSGQIVFLDAGLYTKIKDMSWMLFQGSPFLTEKEKEALDELVKKRGHGPE